MDQSKRMNVYFISGLGADRRAFQKLVLPPHWHVHHIEWIRPQKNESLDHYAGRLSQVIDITQPFALVGLSFGGMIAAAMNDYLHPQKTVIISSIGAAGQLPWYFKFAGLTRLYRLIPVALIRDPNKISNWLFGAKSPAEKKLLAAIITSTDPGFIKWSLGAILRWRNKKRPEGLIHIHGSRDRILPVACTHADIIIPNGSHFMVWTRAQDVSKALVEAIEPGRFY
jgi:pimeloyl-ACP methyl ester carboxylesterase